MKWRKSYFTAVGVLCLAMDAHAFSLAGSIFEKVGKKVEVDPLLLYAVALTESALYAGSGNIAPYPYVIRSDEGPKFFDEFEAAEKELKRVLQRTHNVDVGLMQINLRHHPQPHPTHLLNPEANLEYGAKYLKKTMASTEDPVVGVGRYHSYTERLANWYGRRVWTIYYNLKEIGGNHNA